MQTKPPHSSPTSFDGPRAATTAATRIVSLVTRCANEIVSFCRLLAGDAPARRGQVVERVTVENGVVRVARYVHGRLVDQRRVEARDLVIERRLDRARRCMRVEIRAGGRAIEIGRGATPTEKENAIERLAASLREIEAEPRIRTTSAKHRAESR